MIQTYQDLKNLKVAVGSIYIDAKGKERVQCLMSDNSIWVCDRDGTNWHPAVLPIDELSKRFLIEVSRRTTPYVIGTNG